MSDWPLDSGSFFSWSYLLKEIGFEKKKWSFLKLFDNSLSKHSISKNFLYAVVVLGYLPKLNRGLRLVFGA